MNTTIRTPADLSKDEIEKEIRELIMKAVGDVVRDVRFDWKTLSDHEAQVEIFVMIDPASNPKQWRNNFSGLTSRVREVMGSGLDWIFPVIMARASSAAVAS